MVAAFIVPLITAAIAAGSSTGTLVANRRRARDRAERMRDFTRFSQQRDLASAMGLARATPGVSPGLAQRNTLNAFERLNDQSQRQAMEQSMADRQVGLQEDQARNQLIGGMVSSIGSGIAQGVASSSAAQKQAAPVQASGGTTPNPATQAAAPRSPITPGTMNVPMGLIPPAVQGPQAAQGAQANQVAMAQAQVPSAPLMAPPQPTMPPMPAGGDPMAMPQSSTLPGGQAAALTTPTLTPEEAAVAEEAVNQVRRARAAPPPTPTAPRPSPGGISGFYSPRTETPPGFYGTRTEAAPPSNTPGLYAPRTEPQPPAERPGFYDEPEPQKEPVSAIDRPATHRAVQIRNRLREERDYRARVDHAEELAKDGDVAGLQGLGLDPDQIEQILQAAEEERSQQSTSSTRRARHSSRTMDAGVE